jgi:hypothetical protein
MLDSSTCVLLQPDHASQEEAGTLLARTYQYAYSLVLKYTKHLREAFECNRTLCLNDSNDRYCLAVGFMVHAIFAGFLRA